MGKPWHSSKTLFFESANKFSQDDVQLRKVIAELLEASKSSEQYELCTYYWEGDPIPLTYGQAKTLADNNCRIFMEDDEGFYYEMPLKPPHVQKCRLDMDGEEITWIRIGEEDK